MADEFTAKFKVDISDLKKNIADAEQSIKEANATFRSETGGMDKWSTNVEGLEAKLKQLKTVLESQKTVLKNYQDELERNEKAYEQNGKRADEFRSKLQDLEKNGVSKTSDTYKYFAKQLTETIKEQEKNEQATKDLKVQVLNQKGAVAETEKAIKHYEDAEKDLDKTSDKLKKTVGSLASAIGKGLKNAFVAVGAAAASAVTAMAAAAVSASDYADEILTTSDVTGIATDKLQAYSYAAELVDVSVDTLTGAMKKNIKSMSSASKGTGQTADAYKKLGIQVTDANGELRDSEEVFWEAIDALGQIENETERDATAMELFGKSAQELNPLIKAGSDKMAELTEEAKQMGAVMSGEQLEALGQFNDSLQRLKSGASAAKNALGTVLLPQLKLFADDGVELLGQVSRGLLDANGDFEKMGDVLSEAIGKATTMLMDDLPKLLDVGVDIVLAIVDSLVKSVPDLVLGATSMIKKVLESLGTIIGPIIESLPQILDAVLKELPSIIDDLAAQLPVLIKGLAKSLPEFINSILENLPAIIEAVINALPEILDAIIEELPEMAVKLGEAIYQNFPKIVETIVKGMFKIGIGNLIAPIVDPIERVISYWKGPSSGSLDDKDVVKTSRQAMARLNEKTGEIVEETKQGLKTLDNIGRGNAAQSSGASAGGAGNAGTTVNYTQNISSPKALSRAEIYRDTKNMLSLVGGFAE